MSLIRLLLVGQSVVRKGSVAGRYKLVKGRALPEFGPQPPRRDLRGRSQSVATFNVSKLRPTEPQCAEPNIQVSLKGSEAHDQSLKPTPHVDAHNGSDEHEGVSAIWKRNRQSVGRTMTNPFGKATASDLTLNLEIENVTVMRNDLIESDLHVVPRRLEVMPQDKTVRIADVCDRNSGARELGWQPGVSRAIRFVRSTVGFFTGQHAR